MRSAADINDHPGVVLSLKRTGALTAMLLNVRLPPMVWSNVGAGTPLPLGVTAPVTGGTPSIIPCVALGVGVAPGVGVTTVDVLDTAPTDGGDAVAPTDVEPPVSGAVPTEVLVGALVMTPVVDEIVGADVTEFPDVAVSDEPTLYTLPPLSEYPADDAPPEIRPPGARTVGAFASGTFPPPME